MKYLYNLLLLILFFQLIFSYQNHHRPKKTKSLFFRFSEKKHLSKQFADSVPETEVKVLKEGWLRLSSVQLMVKY